MSQANAVLEIVESVSRATNREMDALPPLHESIDCDGLKLIVNSEGFIKTKFQYAGETITLTSNGDGFDVSLS